MAEIAKSGTPSLATTLPCPAHQNSGLTAGVDIGAFDACYIADDGTVQLSDGTAADAAARVDGYAARSYVAGDPDVTLYYGVRIRYGSGLTPGARYYVSETVAGGLSDVATIGGTAPVAHAVDSTRVEVYRSTY